MTSDTLDHDIDDTGITVPFWLPRIPDRELDLFWFLVIRRIADRGAFGSWLEHLLFQESYRRVRNLDIEGIPREPGVIRLPWFTDRELATALKTATILSYCTLPVAAGELVDAIVRTLTAFASYRLCRRATS